MPKRFFKLPYIISYLCAFVLGMKQLREPDVWWQLLSGRWMLENNAVTRSDMFSYTMEGTEWINVKWLYEVVIAFLEKGLGPLGVMLLQSLVNVVIVYLLLRILWLFTRHLGKSFSTLFSTITVLLFLAISEFRMAGRPEMVSHLFTVVYLFILWRSDNNNWKNILWLIPLQCLWANMHDGYPVGMVLIGMYIAGGFISYLISKHKEYLQGAVRLSAVFGGMALIILVNPNTIQLWKQPFEIFRQLKVNKYTSELYNFTEPEYWTLQAKMHIVILLAVALFWVWKIVARKKTGKPVQFTPLLTGYLISIPVLGYLSLTANRNIPFAQIALFPSLPLVFMWLTDVLSISAKPFYRNAMQKTIFISTLLAAVFYVTVVSNAWYSATKSPNRYGLHVNTLHNPTSAAEFIKTYQLKGPAFSDYFVSSYLLWSLYPDFKSYIDLRDLDIFPAKFFDDYFDMYNNPERFQELDSVYKFNYIVLSTSQLTSLQQNLYWGEGFNVVHIDPVCVIMLRHVEENEAINTGEAARKLFVWPQDPIDPGWATALTSLLNPANNYDQEDIKRMPIYAARFYNMVRNYRISLQFLLPAIATDYADDAEALAITGTSYMGYTNFTDKQEEIKVRLDSAVYFFNRALLQDPENTESYLGLATIAYQQGQFNKAEGFLADYLKTNKQTDYVYYMYALSIRNAANNRSKGEKYRLVITNMERSLELNKYNIRAHLYLSEAFWALDDLPKAKEHLMALLGKEIQWSPSEKNLIETLKKSLGVTEIKEMKDLLKTE